MSSYYSSDDDIDIRVRRHGGQSPGPVRYVQAPPRPQSYYTPQAQAGPSFLAPERHTTVISRSRSRERSRSRDRRSPPVSQAPVAHPPVIINNRIYNEHSDDEDNRRLQLVRPSRSRHSRSRASSTSSSDSSRSRSHSRSKSSKSSKYMTREAWEAEQARQELERMRLASSRETEERRLAKQYRDEAVAEQARQELERLRSTSTRDSDERRLVKQYREEAAAEQARVELERLRSTKSREAEERRVAKQYREEAELQRAQRELDDIKGRDARSKEERRIREDMELRRHKEEKEAAEEKARLENEANLAVERYKNKEGDRSSKEKKTRDEKEKEAAQAVERYKQQELDRIEKEKKAKAQKEKDAADAIERYKQKEAERIAKEKKDREDQERDYQRRLQEDLHKSGLDEEAIAAILKKERIKKQAPVPALPPAPHIVNPAALVMNPGIAPALAPAGRPTYTRMARRHLSVETLRTFHVDFDLDADADYILIKRWVPEWEQDQLWKHTKQIREKRGKMLMIEETRHHRHEPEFEWVREKKKKSDRRRSKSPSLLMYFAGARPA